MIRVLAYTNEPVVALGLGRLLDPEAGFQLISVCDRVQRVASQAAAAAPDILFMDLTPAVSFDALSRVCKAVRGSKVVLWARSISPALAYQAMELGVRGFLRKDVAPEVLLECLRRVVSGERWLDPGLVQPVETAPKLQLTKREGQLVSLLARGLTNREIASALQLNENSVKVYLSKLFRKAGVRDRVALGLCALKNLANVAEHEVPFVPKLLTRYEPGKPKLAAGAPGPPAARRIEDSLLN